jgi:hypothetical protein
MAPVGKGGIGWLGFWSLRRGLGRRSDALSTWQRFAARRICLCRVRRAAGLAAEGAGAGL